MSLNTPKLDDRTFQDIVDEAKKRIPYYTPEWTDHSISDPGITFIELFAWMTEMILYRLNQVPDLHYIKFMELLGITLQAPVPARALISFWLSTPQKKVVTIPSGIEIAAPETAGQPPIIFSTDADFDIQPPQLKTLWSAIEAQDDGSQTVVSHNWPALAVGTESVKMFTAVPQPNDALYFGFENDLSYHILGFDLDLDAGEGIGVDPTNPPYTWEAWQQEGWQPCDVETDTTYGLNRTGRVEIHLPQLAKQTVIDDALFWVRIRIKENSPNDTDRYFRSYRSSPQLKQVKVSTLGGTASTIHAQYIRHERLGKSDGNPGQIFQLQLAPVLPRQGEAETLLIRDTNGSTEAWQEVPDFSTSGPEDKHFTLDGVSGEIRFGPAIRQSDGTMWQYGAIPPGGSALIFTQYRTGGNLEGNIQAGVLNSLRTPLPLIARVVNRQAATGGQEAETVAEVMRRIPGFLRSRNRAVTAEDFEYLAHEADRQVGRAKCLQPSSPNEPPSGRVQVLIIPRIFSQHDNLTPGMLDVDTAVITQIKAYLSERCLLTTRVEVAQPHYVWASVVVELQTEPDQDFQTVQQAILKRLHTFLHPLTGGMKGEGWPFGRDLVVADVYQCLNQIPGVAYLRRVHLFLSDGAGIPEQYPVEYIPVPENGVIASGVHQVILMNMEDINARTG